MAQVNPLDAAFGAEIVGLDLNRDHGDEAIALVAQALYEHQVVVIRDQRLDEAAYLRFGRRWGKPIPHVLDHMRMAGYPELMTVGNTEKRDEDNSIRNGAALWHTDQSYESVPASATMLYSIRVPDSGGETQFCNMARAYEALDDSRRKQVDGLRIAHKYGRGKLRPDEQAANPLINDDQDSRVPVTYHPLVYPHPVTGRKALYALGHGAHGVEGQPPEEGMALIESLKEHVLQEQFIYRHPYRVGDVAIWDTLATMHRATPIDVPKNNAQGRLLWRISVRGKPDIFCDANNE